MKQSPPLFPKNHLSASQQMNQETRLASRVGTLGGAVREVVAMKLHVC